MKKFLPYIAGLLASVIFGFSFLFTKTAIDFVMPFNFLAYRFSFAFLFLVILKQAGFLRAKVSVKSLKDIGFLALVQPLLYFSLEITGISLTTSMEAGIIISTIPIFVLMLSRIFLKEFLNGMQLFSMFLSMAGVILITLSRGFSFSKNLAGALFLIGCSFSAAMYNILSRKASLKYSAADITYHMMLFGFVGFGSIAFFGSMINGSVSFFLKGLIIREVLISALYLGILSSAVTFFLLNFTLSRIPATRASVFPYISTSVALFAGFIFRKERLTSLGIMGTVMIFLGVWWINAFSSKNQEVLK
ncbi:hypothetical protein AT15_08485 [Kosmotoga arenicorallina S304]|uniref:EamA domain-containing protein n=1 Tax=Kosmotoga arenicorallina S304 TaxID=1453497 RepID=A0A176K1V5_9BACT|nr:DMT family transporter [Kosmotoga arenicorallina]OAA31003.1 hypothetical protein AT15_08485 [Kosmotoga arenicorallina S304]